MKPICYSLASESFARSVLLPAVLFGFPTNLASHLGPSPLSHSFWCGCCGRTTNPLRQLGREFRILVIDAV
jgi:hypothetical protein